MNEQVFLDTNVLIYARSGEDSRKQERARLWISRAAAHGVACLNRQILNELTWWILRREPRRALDDIRTEVDALSVFGIEPVTLSDVEVAWAIRAAFGFQWYDCLLLAAAQRAECSIFLSEDMTDGATIGGVTIVNPFIHHPDEFLPAD
jgi:predicted nucleic acid-binding protein